MLVALAQLVRRAGTERIRAGQGLVDHHADGPHVGRGGRSRTLAGLGRHVRERAEHAVVDGRVGLVERGDAEVEHAHGAVAAEQDVRGLHVAVHDAVLVRMRETGADGGGDAQERRVAELPLAQRAGEVHALDDVGCDVDVLAVLVDAAQAHDVRVPELARDGRLAPRALAQRRVVRDRLEGHDLLALEIERAEHRPGPAHAEDAVDPEAVADHPRGEQRGACLTSGFRHQETAPGRGVRGRSGGSIGASCKGSDIRSGPAGGAFAPAGRDRRSPGESRCPSSKSSISTTAPRPRSILRRRDVAGAAGAAAAAAGRICAASCRSSASSSWCSSWASWCSARAPARPRPTSTAPTCRT